MELSTKTYDKPFEANDNTKITFGKHKGKNHKYLLEEQNEGYIRWLLEDTEANFGKVTKAYIMKARGN